METRTASELRCEKLIKAFAKNGIVATLDSFGDIGITLSVFVIRISPYSSYSDRGRWLVHAEPIDYTRASVDGADQFPRYYFHDTSVINEITTWLHKRIAQQMITAFDTAWIEANVNGECDDIGSDAYIRIRNHYLAQTDIVHDIRGFITKYLASPEDTDDC